MAKPIPLPALARLNELFRYNSRTGVVTRKITTNGRAKKGEVVGCADKNGYLVASVDGRLYKLHRIIWYMWHEEDPIDEVIDHRDGVTSHNWIKNLRKATDAQNGCNRGANSNNTSGFKGVHHCKQTSKWSATVMVNRKPIWLGRFNTPEEADAAIRLKREQLHKEFHRHE